MLRPAVEMLGSEFLDGAARERLRLRLAAYLAAEIGNGLAPLFQVMAAPKPEFRGLIHRLGEAIGVLPGAETQPSLRAALKPLGIEAGQFAVFLPALLKPKAAGMRALLWGLWHNTEPPVLPAAGLVSAPAWDDAAAALAMGWVTAGPVMLRLDIAEKMARELNYLIRKHPVPLPAGLGSRMSLKPEQLPAALNRLGFRIIPSATLADQNYGPPAPPMLARRKAVKPVADKPLAEPPSPLPDNPFAALAALRQGVPRRGATRRGAPRRVAS
jgi:ATP-dependent RNA helicase SUPV3L1/SUV3